MAVSSEESYLSDSQVYQPSAGVPQKSCPKGLSEDDVWCYYQQQEQYLGRNIQLADTKAGAVLLTLTSLTAYLLKDENFHKSMRPLFSDELRTVLLAFNRTEVESLTAALAILFAFLGACLAYFSVLPRGLFLSKASESAAGASSAQGVVFFGDIARSRSDTSFEHHLRTLDKQEVSNQRISHVIALSRVCLRKMKLLYWSMVVGGLGILSGVAWIIIYI